MARASSTNLPSPLLSFLFSRLFSPANGHKNNIYVDTFRLCCCYEREDYLEENLQHIWQHENREKHLSFYVQFSTNSIFSGEAIRGETKLRQFAM